jgi:hypothetical protein
VLTGGVLAVFVGGLVLLGSYALIQRSFEPQGGLFGTPTRIPICGRSYVGPAATVSMGQIVATITPGFSPVVVEPSVGQLPLFAPFQGQHCATGPDTVTTLVFLHVGPDAYAEYDLEGGP